MKKVVLASLLAVACAGPLAYFGFAQPAAAGQAAAGQTVEMSPEEGAAYNNRENPGPHRQVKQPRWEAYLKSLSSVRSESVRVAVALLFAYSQGSDNAKTLDAADRLLQVAPDNFLCLCLRDDVAPPNWLTTRPLPITRAKDCALTGTKGVSGYRLASGSEDEGLPGFLQCHRR